MVDSKYEVSEDVKRLLGLSGVFRGSIVFEQSAEGFREVSEGFRGVSRTLRFFRIFHRS